MPEPTPERDHAAMNVLRKYPMHYITGVHNFHGVQWFIETVADEDEQGAARLYSDPADALLAMGRILDGMGEEAP